MATPSPRLRQWREPHITKQAASSTGELTGTSTQAFDGKRRRSDKFLTEFTVYNTLSCRSSTTQVAPSDMALAPTLVRGPDLDPWLELEFKLATALTKQSSRIQNPVQDNLWTDFVTNPRNAPPKAAKQRDVYNDLMSSQMSEDVEAHITKFRSSTMNASFEPADPTTTNYSGLLAGILNQETQRETLDSCPAGVTQKEQKRRNMVRASSGQNDTQNVGGKTTEQWSCTTRAPNQSQSSRIVGQNCSRDPNVMNVNSARVTITDKEIQRYETKVRCSLCFGRRYVYSSRPTRPLTPKNAHKGLTTSRTESVMTHDQNEDRNNENDDTCARVAKAEISPKNEPNEVAEDAPKSEDVVINQICSPL